MNKTKNKLLAPKLEIASTLYTRSRGLLGRQSLARENALWIERCRSIHTFFMNFAIDAAFVDKNMRVLATYDGLVPWRLAMPLNFKIRSVIELAEGVLSETGTEIGDELYVVAEDS
ncbi:MAG: DUF192 domain-containing protein [Bdellovibrionia bacterium]